ncbi:MAG: hypothetical protein CL574_03305 [Altererythrobacter sp.]|nr:hypothetical protein [Altererythrobacter sp.]
MIECTASLGCAELALTKVDREFPLFIEEPPARVVAVIADSNGEIQDPREFAKGKIQRLPRSVGYKRIGGIEAPDPQLQDQLVIDSE